MLGGNGPVAAVSTDILLLRGFLSSVRIFFVRSPCRTPEIEPAPNGIEPLRLIVSAIADEIGGMTPTSNTNAIAVMDTVACLSFDFVNCMLSIIKK